MPTISQVNGQISCVLNVATKLTEPSARSPSTSGCATPLHLTCHTTAWPAALLLLWEMKNGPLPLADRLVLANLYYSANQNIKAAAIYREIDPTYEPPGVLALFTLMAEIADARA